MSFLHTPYASGKPPFAIGLAPLDPARWIEQDAHLADQLALKEAILAREGAAAFGALAGAEAGQAEALELLAAHLPARFPQTYRREGSALRVLPGDRLVAFGGEPALLTASRLVQEDLLLMRRCEGGWRLVAGSLCFPSTWVLAEKLGRDMDAIHGPVPGYAGKMAGTIARIFDNLKVEQPVERLNWSIYGDARLRYAQSKQDPLSDFRRARRCPSAPISGSSARRCAACRAAATSCSRCACTSTRFPPCRAMRAVANWRARCTISSRR